MEHINKEEKNKILLEIYKDANYRSIEEIKEFFTVNSIFLALLGTSSIISFLSCIENFKNQQVFFWTGGLFLAIIWYFSNIGAMKWKKWWQGRSEAIYWELIKDITKDGKLLSDFEKILDKEKPRLIDFCCCKEVELHVTWFICCLPIIFISFFFWKLNFFSNYWPIIIVVLLLYSLHASYRYQPRQKAEEEFKKSKN